MDRAGRSSIARVAGVLATCATFLTIATFAPSSPADDAGAGPVARPAAPSAVHVVPADLEDVEHMCALLTACDKLPLPSGLVPKDFASCTRALYAELASGAAVSFSLTLRDCGLRASSCGELRSCALRGARPDICAGRGKAGPVDMCDADGRAITCTNERVTLVRDCPRGGEQCAVREGHAICALGSCEKDAAPACSPSGTRVLECKKGTLLSLDCGAFGLKCAPSSEGPRCATQGASCQEDTTRCEGRSAIACWHGHEVRVDCGARGLGCGSSASSDGGSVGASGVADGGGVAAPVGACTGQVPAAGATGAAGACDPSAPARCDGATLRWCAWGQPRGYLCKSVGLQRCVAGETGARCAP